VYPDKIEVRYDSLDDPVHDLLSLRGREVSTVHPIAELLEKKVAVVSWSTSVTAHADFPCTHNPWANIFLQFESGQDLLIKLLALPQIEWVDYRMNDARQRTLYADIGDPGAVGGV
jgi:hypothetical protein